MKVKKQKVKSKSIRQCFGRQEMPVAIAVNILLIILIYILNVR